MTTQEEHDLESYVEKLLGFEKAAMWWTTPNPMFGGVKPRDVPREKVLAFIRNARYENGDSDRSNGDL